MAATSSLELEAQSLQRTVAAAAKNVFLPAAARDAIVQAGFLVQLLVHEVIALRDQVRANGETVNGELLEMRQQLKAHNIDTVL